MSNDAFGSWGRLFASRSSILRMPDRSSSVAGREGSLLPYGIGRSYGDSCLNDGGTLIAARDLNRFIAFDSETGIFRCEAGVLLSEIVDVALPKGWFLPVTPGTKMVTVGGAIANDVHGKNHHRSGTIGHHLLRFELLRSDGSRIVCAPDVNGEWFRATVGGLGLTGLITWAEIRLKAVAGPWIGQRAIRFASLAEFFSLCDPLESENEYLVAWLDCASARKGSSRGVFFAGDHDSCTEPLPRRRTMRVPIEPPFSLVNELSVRAFNEVYFRRPRGGDGVRTRVPFDAFFYPLDSIHEWNRIYGRRGFMQYQCVVPEGEAGRRALGEILERIAASGEGSFLGVLKRFGTQPSVGLMSFPMAGFTVALDFPFRGPSTLALFDGLDDVVVNAGGRVYPAKDARMAPEMFRAFYPGHEEFARYIDPHFSSSFWRRVTGGERLAFLAS